MYSAMGANPGREVRQSSSPVGQVAEVSFDVRSLSEQLLAEPWLGVFQEVLGAQSASGLFPVAVTTMGTIAPRREQLQIATLVADLVQRIRVVVAVGQHIALDRCHTQHAGGHHPFVHVQRCHSAIEPSEP